MPSLARVEPIVGGATRCDVQEKQRVETKLRVCHLGVRAAGSGLSLAG
jgi:hypothetical protein